MTVRKETIKFYSWKRDSQQSTSPKITTHIDGGKKAIYFAHCLAKRYTPSFTKRGTQEKRHSNHLIISKIWQNHPFNFQGPTKWSLLNHPLPRNCINTWLLYFANPSKGLTSLPQWPYFFNRLWLYHNIEKLLTILNFSKSTLHPSKFNLTELLGGTIQIGSLPRYSFETASGLQLFIYSISKDKFC